VFSYHGSSAHSVHGTAACLNPNEVVSQIVQLLLDARLARFTDGHNANHCGNADGDAKHSQQAAHLVSRQRHQRRPH